MLTRRISVNFALRKRRISTEKLKNSTPTNFSILEKEEKEEEKQEREEEKED